MLGRRWISDQYRKRSVQMVDRMLKETVARLCRVVMSDPPRQAVMRQGEVNNREGPPPWMGASRRGLA